MPRCFVYCSNINACLDSLSNSSSITSFLCCADKVPFTIACWRHRKQKKQKAYYAGISTTDSWPGIQPRSSKFSESGSIVAMLKLWWELPAVTSHERGGMKSSISFSISRHSDELMPGRTEEIVQNTVLHQQKLTNTMLKGVDIVSWSASLWKFSKFKTISFSKIYTANAQN